MATAPHGRPRLLVTRKLPDEVEARIERSYDAILNDTDEVFDDDGLIARAEGCEALLVTSTEKCNAALIARLPASVKIIATFSVGYDHIDVDAATTRGILVTNTPDVLSAATADIAILLLLGAARGAYWGERMVREDRWGAWSAVYPLGYEVTGKRLGILGMGRIGRAMARRARGFDMEIHYHNRSRLAPEDEDGATYHTRVEDMLPHCDLLSIHCASTPQTRGLIDEARIALLPDDAILVNTARGDIVDDDALIAALKTGKLAAAGLDVYRNEPDIHPGYRGLDNAFLLPHLGSATIETRTAMGFRALDNLDAFFAGENPGDQLNRI